MRIYLIEEKSDRQEGFSGASAYSSSVPMPTGRRPTPGDEHRHPTAIFLIGLTEEREHATLFPEGSKNQVKGEQPRRHQLGQGEIPPPENEETGQIPGMAGPGQHPVTA